MGEADWKYMMEKMQEIRLFSRTMIRRATKEYKISAEQLELLSYLSISKERITPMDLSKIMGVNKTIISRIIEQLSSNGYLIKERDENDKRSYFVYITEKGNKQVNLIYDYYLHPIYELRRRLGEEEFIEFMKYIENANIKMKQ